VPVRMSNVSTEAAFLKLIFTTVLHASHAFLFVFCNAILICNLFAKYECSDGIACRILIQNEQLAQVNTFPYLGSDYGRW